jgi:NAD(P)-dependent dehydrogenase (short-subunit alcohol dehydrogenase family)
MTHPLFRLTGRVALVSGAASGFGRAMSIGFAEAGADLMLADIDSDGMQATAVKIHAMGCQAVPVLCDMTDPEQIETLFAALDREYGKIDVLGNVVGPAVLGPPDELALGDVQKIFQGLIFGRFYCCQQAGRRMLAAGKGSIINIGSTCSMRANGRGHIAYSMAMGGVAQMTRELSTEWSGRGVRVNAILPAQTPNEFLKQRMRDDPALEKRFLRGIPMGRLGVPEDIKGPAIFLASDASAWVTGALIPMDGGNLAKLAGGSHPGMPE